MPRTEPLVSVIIANHNYGRFLKQCIDSVIAQTWRQVEIIVVDDGSTDDSRDVVAGYGAAVRSLFQANAGQAAALSAGFAISNGDLIALLDADDGWHANKLQTVVGTFQARPQTQWLRHKLALVNEHLEPLGPSLPAYHGSAPVPGDPVMLLEGGITAGTSLVMRRALAARVFPVTITPELALHADDAVIFAKVLATGAAGYSLDEVLGFYRRHAGTRFTGDDLPALLAREVALANALGKMVGYGRPSAGYKLASVLAALNGARMWEAARVGNYLRGLGAAARLWKRPALLARQTASLTYAFAAPRAWARKLRARAAPPT